MRALLLLLISSTAAAGTIKGTVTFKGTPPTDPPADRSNDTFCAGVDPPPPLITKGKLAEAVVQLIGDFDGSGDAPADPVTITQSKCLYSPRVTVMRDGQTLQIVNDDPTFHNVRIVRDGKVVLNKPQMKGADPLTTDPIEGAGPVVELHCDVHPWMKSWVVVAENPYYAVTGADGKFSITDVPPGKYEIVVWHPGLDPVRKKVRVKKGKKATKVDLRMTLDDCGGC